MAKKLLSSIDPHMPFLNILHARRIIFAKDALCRTELELMELLDLPLASVNSVVQHISDCICPPCRNLLSVMEERLREPKCGHLPTTLHELDSALCGGVPFGALTEIVGPAGIGKTQLCLLLSVVVALPEASGGQGGTVIYFDIEHTFSPKRMVEIAQSRFPNICTTEDVVREMASRVLVFHPLSLADFNESLSGLDDEAFFRHKIKLIIVDSITSLLESDNTYNDASRKQNELGILASKFKALAETLRIPVVVTNQVRAEFGSKATFQFEGPCLHQNDEEAIYGDEIEMHVRAALGTTWAHSVNIRLMLESSSYLGQAHVKVVKSPISATLAFPYRITAAGLEFAEAQVFEEVYGSHVSEGFHITDFKEMSMDA